MWYDKYAEELDAVVKYPAMVFPLLRVMEIPRFHKGQLFDTGFNYVKRSCGLSHRNFVDVVHGDGKFLNSTPGGLLSVRRETWPEYNAVHRAMVDFVTDVGLVKTFREAQLPFCVHVITPQMAKNPAIVQRPHSTYKMHSDIWSGQPANLVHLWIPIFGSFKEVSCEWYEPRDFPEEAMRRFDNYSERIPVSVSEGAQKYDVDIDFGMAYVSHGLSLHRTVLKPISGVELGRITLDVRFRLKGRERGPLFHGDYVPMDEWLDVGTKSAYISDISVEEFRK